MMSETEMLMYAINLIQRGNQVEIQRCCDELRRRDVIRAELNVPIEVETHRAEQSTKH